MDDDRERAAFHARNAALEQDVLDHAMAGAWLDTYETVMIDSGLTDAVESMGLAEMAMVGAAALMAGSLPLAVGGVALIGVATYSMRKNVLDSGSSGTPIVALTKTGLEKAQSHFIDQAISGVRLKGLTTPSMPWLPSTGFIRSLKDKNQEQLAEALRQLDRFQHRHRPAVINTRPATEQERGAPQDGGLGEGEFSVQIVSAKNREIKGPREVSDDTEVIKVKPNQGQDKSPPKHGGDHGKH